jgi:hypothetical protein
MDLVQRYMAAWKWKLDELGLSLLANEFNGLTDDEKGRLLAQLDRIRPEHYRTITTMGKDVRPYQVWSRYRETYEPHPAMSRALVDMKTDTTVPGQVFQRLRHPNPMFLLPGAPPLIHADGSPGRIIAMTVTGALTGRDVPRPGSTAALADDAPGNASVLLDTHDPNANAYLVQLLSEVHNPEGTQVIETDWCTLTVPITGSFTLEELVERTAGEGFSWERYESTHDLRQGYLLTMARVAVSHLLYASSRTVELDDKPRASRPPAKRVKGAPRPEPSARIRRMGWATGAVIADRVRRPGSDRPAPGTGRSVRPHIRGAHLHLYRVGPGRQEIDIKWLDPIPVNAGLDDGRTITNHPVR